MGAFGEDMKRLHPADMTITFEQVAGRFRASLLAQEVALPDKDDYDDDKCSLRCDTQQAIRQWLNQQKSVSPSHIVGATPELYSRDCSHHINDAFDNTISQLAESILVDALYYEFVHCYLQ